MAAILSAGQNQNRLLEGRIASAILPNAAQAQGFAPGPPVARSELWEADNTRFANDARARSCSGEEAPDATFQNAARGSAPGRCQQRRAVQYGAVSGASRKMPPARSSAMPPVRRGFGEPRHKPPSTMPLGPRGFNEALGDGEFRQCAARSLHPGGGHGPQPADQ